MDILMELAKAIPYGVLAYLFMRAAYRDIEKNRETLTKTYEHSMDTFNQLAAANKTSLMESRIKEYENTVKTTIESAINNHSLVDCPYAKKGRS